MEEREPTRIDRAFAKEIAYYLEQAAKADTIEDTEKALLNTILRTVELTKECKKLGLYFPTDEVISIYNTLAKELKELKEKK